MQNYSIRWTLLLKWIGGPVSGQALAVNMLTRLKQCRSLPESTFILLFHHSDISSSNSLAPLAPLRLPTLTSNSWNNRWQRPQKLFSRGSSSTCQLDLFKVYIWRSIIFPVITLKIYPFFYYKTLGTHS